MQANQKNNSGGNSKDEFGELKKEEQKQLVEWCKDAFLPIRTVNKEHTSYGLKEMFEKSQKGFYINNGAFKGAMLEAGFKVSDEDALNWKFKISKRSPALLLRKN